MKNVEDLLNKAKEVSGSDYQTSQMLGVDRQRISGWRARRSLPSVKAIIEMSENYGIDLKEALLAVEYSREFERPMKQAGFATLPMMTTLGAISGLTLLTTSQLPYEALAAGIACVSSVYYVKS